MKTLIDTRLQNNTDCRVKCNNPYVLQALREYVESSKIAKVTKSNKKLFWFHTENRADACQIIEELVTASKTAIEEAPYYQPWIVRNFWLIWALLWGIWDFGNEIVFMLQGDFAKMSLWGITGVFVVLISIKNYWNNKKHIELINAGRTKNGNKPTA